MSLLEILLTPERRKEARDRQVALRGRFGARVAQNPPVANYLFGLAREQQALDQLSAIKTEEIGTQGAKDRESALFNQLAEGLALQARFEEAAKVAASESHKAEYTAKMEALERIGVGCQCPPEIIQPSSVDAKGKRTPSRHKTEEVFDGRAVITFSRCLLCQNLMAQIG